MNYGKANIMRIANDSGNTGLYTYAFSTNQQIYEKLEKVFPDLPKHKQQKQVLTWLNKKHFHYGSQKSRRVNNVAQRDRYLWLCTAETTGKNSDQ